MKQYLLGLISGVILGALGLLAFWGIGNLGQTTTIDRSGPVVLESIQDLARFVAAEGSFYTVIDHEEQRTLMPGLGGGWTLPSFLAGERIVSAVYGTVEAYVDFAELDESNVQVCADEVTATIFLPAPSLTEPRIDLAQSHVMSHNRGLFDAFGDLFSADLEAQQQMLLAGQYRIAEAAQAGELHERAKVNTERTLTVLLTALGFESVTIIFDGVPESPTEDTDETDAS
ncbi:MAG: DUF4230 domain-containing protein [Promicromonosporaceae bacterium]|nr:DUF4230 domain-containing protein [Promicromonosporaceae bacterium]